MPANTVEGLSDASTNLRLPVPALDLQHPLERPEYGRQWSSESPKRSKRLSSWSYTRAPVRRGRNYCGLAPIRPRSGYLGTAGPKHAETSTAWLQRTGWTQAGRLQLGVYDE